MAKRRGEIPEETERTGAIPAPRHLDDITDRSVTQEPSANTEALYRVLAENATDVVLLTDATAHITWVSPSAGQEWGVDPGELIGLPSNTDIHPDDLAEVESVIRRADAGERGIYHEIRRRGNEHRPYRWLGVTASATLDDEGRVVGHIVSARDIHEQVVARQALADSERRYRLLAEHASDVVCRISDDGRLEWVSDSVLAVLGWQPAEILGRQFRDLVRPSRNPDDTDRTAAREERQVLRADGTFLWMTVILRRVVTDEATFEVAALRDVQQEHDTRARWERLIQHDRLTGLAALPLGLTRLERLLGQSSARHRAGAVAVLCVSIDSLKPVNDAVTFAAGDLLLVEMATRIRSVQPDPDLITRGSGAEFLIAMPGLAAGADAARAAEELLAACTVSVTIAGHTIEPTISIGIAAGRPGAHADDLLRDAALAMREAKRSGHNRYQFAEPQLATEARERLVMEEQVRAGLRHGQFVPWYQPVTALADGALVGYEALVRWDRGDGADVPPDEFLPHAERTGLITELDFEVLRQVVAQLSRLPTALTVAVNVSPTTLRLPDYAGRVLGALRDAGESPTRLHLEVTETALLSATHRISQSMAELADAGVRWYVDDFGTGYSSIVHLRDLPVAGLKLDKSFTAGLETDDPTCTRLAKALAGLAEGLDLDTIAEGVETIGQADILRAQGWRHGQGWLYGHPRPMPLGASEALR